MTVVYQYKAGQEKWMEVVYSLRSLKNLKVLGGIELAFAGDVPRWVNADGILHIATPPQGGRYLDANVKLHSICTDARVSDPFILMYDDIYFNNRMTLAMLPEVVAMPKLPEKTTGSDRWKETMAQSFKALKALGLPCWNFETHLPRIVRKQQMLNVIRQFELLTKSLQRWTCYFNYYLEDIHPNAEHAPCFDKLGMTANPPTLHDFPKLKAGFYGVASDTSYGNNLNRDALDLLLRDKLIINHGNSGLSQHLKNYLMRRFPEPSRWERAGVLSGQEKKMELAGK